MSIIMAISISKITLESFSYLSQYAHSIGQKTYYFIQYNEFVG